MRRFNVVVVLVLSWLVCIADVAVATDEFGRLFFAPNQRAQLDVARAKRDRRAPLVVDTVQAPPPQGPDVVTYSGVVRRSDGKSTVWINGRPITDRTRDNDVSVLGLRRDGAVSVAVPQADRSASLKVGQSLDVTSGTIEEPYARRTTLLKSAAKGVPIKRSVTGDVSTAPATVAGAPLATQRATRRDAAESDAGSGAAPTPLVERGAKN